MAESYTWLLRESLLTLLLAISGILLVVIAEKSSFHNELKTWMPERALAQATLGALSGLLWPIGAAGMAIAGKKFASWRLPPAFIAAAMSGGAALSLATISVIFSTAGSDREIVISQLAGIFVVGLSSGLAFTHWKKNEFIRPEIDAGDSAREQIPGEAALLLKKFIPAVLAGLLIRFALREVIGEGFLLGESRTGISLTGGLFSLLTGSEPLLTPFHVLTPLAVRDRTFLLSALPASSMNITVWVIASRWMRWQALLTLILVVLMSATVFAALIALFTGGA